MEMPLPEGSGIVFKQTFMYRMRFLMPAAMICGMAACQPGATQQGTDSTATAALADSTLPDVELPSAKDTAAASEFGLPDTVTIHGQLYRVVPSTEELFNSAPEFKPDTSEAKNIAQWKDKAHRNGDTLILQLRNGAEKRLVQNHNDDDGFEDYVFQGYIPALKSFVVWRNGYEYYDVLLVHESAGEVVNTIGLPQVSPDGKRFITCNTDLVAAFTANGFEYYGVTANGLEKQYEYNPDKWGPSVIKWLDGQWLVGKFGVLTKDMEVIEHYVRLMPVR